MSHPGMQLYDVMRTTFAAREFTDDPLPDEVLERIFDNARFAPSGGNRQGAHVTVVRDAAVGGRGGAPRGRPPRPPEAPQQAGGKNTK
jgi:nitroreductase